MSRIGKLPISLPQGVEVSVSNDHIVTVKGKLGTLQQKIDESISVHVE
ncbi:MAG: 50S ribosomal protein L6, partial [Bacteroidales bacterium]|nr:50S ribosomal protein L6 [Bacteroidales bacterium]